MSGEYIRVLVCPVCGKEFVPASQHIYKVKTNLVCTVLRNRKGVLTMKINQLANEIHENAKAHGWWDEERSFGEIIALCHSELSEALEAYRNGEEFEWDNNGKPDGIAVEMVDCVIRIFDYLSKEGIDIERILIKKHLYNETRPYRHGGKKI